MVQQKNATTISKTLNQAESTSINLNALIGPTIPIKPNPADSFRSMNTY